MYLDLDLYLNLYLFPYLYLYLICQKIHVTGRVKMAKPNINQPSYIMKMAMVQNTLFGRCHSSKHPQIS